jgi:isopenicillin N synthase-like dioxygenase
MSELHTFHLPDTVTGNQADIALADDMIRAWRRDGIFQIATRAAQNRVIDDAYAASKRFFALPMAQKASHIDELSYSGYIASGEEMTAGEADYSETFTICKDLPPDDARVRAGWPCHGPVPWPDAAYRDSMNAVMGEFGAIGDKLLRLVALGLKLDDIDAIARLTQDGWHHMRVLRYPTESSRTVRGIGAHTDYGLLVITAQNDVGGLYIRPPVEGEKRMRNWLPSESSAGMYETQDLWMLVQPVPHVLTVFPGDILQFLTRGYLLATPHKVRLSARERYSAAYFHEPNFDTCIRPLLGVPSDEYIHYGRHFTSMFMRSYPERITTRRIVEEDRFSIVERLASASADRTHRRPAETEILLAS